MYLKEHGLLLGKEFISLNKLWINPWSVLLNNQVGLLQTMNKTVF